MTVASWVPTHPIDLASSIARYTRWGDDLLSVVHEGDLYRVGQSGDPYRIRQLASGEIEVATEGDSQAALAETQYRLGATFSFAEVERLAKQVPTIAAQLARMPGYRPPMNNGVLESLVGSISAQQVNLQWAATTRNRLVERYGTRHTLGGVTVWEFPPADTLADTDPAEIRSLQYTTRKSEYIVDAARAVTDGTLAGLEDLPDEEVIKRIISVRGLGLWTAEWYLARTLARPNAIAAGDLGVRKAVSRFVAQVDENLPEAGVRALTADWGDGGNWGTHLLLEALSTD